MNFSESVSIPYGKGKVVKTNEKINDRSQVSIPYGKGKGRKRDGLSCRSRVSIPYGKGKEMANFVFESGRVVYQFPMGKVKKIQC